MTPNVKYVISETIKICKELMFRNNRFNESKSRRQKSISERVLRESLTSLISISKIYEARGNINPLLNSIKFGDNLKELYALSFGAEDLETGRFSFTAKASDEYNFIYDNDLMKDMSKEGEMDFKALRHVYNRLSNEKFINLINDTKKIKEEIDKLKDKINNAKTLSDEDDREEELKESKEIYLKNVREISNKLMEIANEFFDYFTDDERETLEVAFEIQDIETISNVVNDKIEELNDSLEFLRKKPKEKYDQEISKMQKQRADKLNEKKKAITEQFKSLLNTINTDEEVNNFLLIRGYDTDKYKYMGSTILINLVQYGFTDALKYVLTEWLPKKIEDSVASKKDEIIESSLEENLSINNVVDAIEDEINQIKYEMNEIELSSSEYSEYEDKLNWLLKLLKFTRVPCDINLELLNISYNAPEADGNQGRTAYGLSFEQTFSTFKVSKQAFKDFITKVSKILDDKNINASSYKSDDFILLKTAGSPYNERNTKKLWTMLEQIWQNYDMSDYEGENYTKKDLRDILAGSKLRDVIKIIPSENRIDIIDEYQETLEKCQDNLDTIKTSEDEKEEIEKHQREYEKNIEDCKILIMSLEEKQENEEDYLVLKSISKKIREFQKTIKENEKKLNKIDIANKTIKDNMKKISELEKSFLEDCGKILSKNKNITSERKEQILKVLEEKLHEEIWE